ALRQPNLTLFPYTTLFRSVLKLPLLIAQAIWIPLRFIDLPRIALLVHDLNVWFSSGVITADLLVLKDLLPFFRFALSPLNELSRSEEHTSELQSRVDLVCC